MSSEISKLQKLLVHRPDKGIGRIIPDKLDDWLYDDTVFLIRMQEEYDTYLKTLLYFLDMEKVKHLNLSADNLRPDSSSFIASDKVVDVQKILEDALASDPIEKDKLIAAVCAFEGTSQKVQLHLEGMKPKSLARTLITGFLRDFEDSEYIFPPIPNLVFTRDIGIVIKDHILLSKTLYRARKRESILARYIAYSYLFKDAPEKVIEITEPSDFFLLTEAEKESKLISIEGGDIMMVSPRHLLVGCSERTSPNGVNEIIHEVFSRDMGIEKVSVIKIPKNRAQMHIDTIFTQVKRNVWALYGDFSDALQKEWEATDKAFVRELYLEDTKFAGRTANILQFYKKKHGDEPYDHFKDYLLRDIDYERLNVVRPVGLDGLLRQVSVYDFGCSPKEVKFIYSGNNEFPYDDREQWTDSCNYLAIKEGVVIGYDRNEHTAVAFANAGFRVVKAVDLIRDFEQGISRPDDITDTLILLPSAELSRARGGSHCMSMPIQREPWKETLPE